MRVNVYDARQNGECIGTRYVDEAIEAHCVGSVEALDEVWREARRELREVGRFWITQDILLMRTGEN